MSQITTHPQNEVVVWPFFLPQIYWLLVRNSHNHRCAEIFENPNFLKNWEDRFFQKLRDYHLIASDESMEDFRWNPNFTHEIRDKTFKNKGEVKDWLNSLGQNKPLVFEKTGRIDRKIVSPAEAIGLIQYRVGKTIDDDKLTSFFFQLFKPDNCPVDFLLGRILSIPFSTLETVKSSPRNILLDCLQGRFFEVDQLVPPVPNEHPSANLNTVIAPFSNWIKKDLDSSLKNALLGFFNFLPKTADYFADGWRDLDPEESYLKEIRKLKSMLNPKEKNRIVSQNLLLVGPPGTGKTFSALQIANEIVRENEIDFNFSARKLKQLSSDLTTAEISSSQNIFLTQFHPSMSYEDFVEGIRPLSTEDNVTVRYAVTSGPIKAIAQLARSYLDASYAIKVRCRFRQEEKTISLDHEYSIYGLENRAGTLSIRDTNGIYQQLATTGGGRIKVKTDLDLSKITEYFSVTWKPEVVEVVPSFVLIIDELNRGNPAKIFGELMVLLEYSKRLGAPGQEGKPILLPYSKEEFILPINLHVICTMNQADRSLATLDQAFKRRFVTKFIRPNFDLVQNSTRFSANPEVTEKVCMHLRQINDAFSSIEIGPDKHVGHYYAIETLNAILIESVPVDEAISRLWTEHLQFLIRDVVPTKDLDSFIEELASLQKSKPTFIIQDLVDIINHPVDHIKVVA